MQVYMYVYVLLYEGGRAYPLPELRMITEADQDKAKAPFKRVLKGAFLSK